MFDIDAAVANRRFTRGSDEPPPGGSGWHYANRDQLFRRWLALYRSEHWSLARIAAFDGVTLAQVWCGLVLALRAEPVALRRRYRRHLLRRQGC